MRTYTVKAGDSPASIAISFAGCPKCTEALVKSNPTKPAVRYPNGFVTFQSLNVGEQLRLPDEWFNGQLDALPQEYFERLPAMPPTGLGAFPVRQGPRQQPPAPTPPSECLANQKWLFGASIAVGANVFPKSNLISYGAFAQAAMGGANPPYNKAIDGVLYRFQQRGTTPTLTPATAQLVDIFYCGPKSIGIGAPAAPGTISTPPPGGAPQPPCCYSFDPQVAYTLVVWPIPGGVGGTPDPGNVLTDLGFNVTNIVANGDGSSTADVIWPGAASVSTTAQDGLNLLVFTDRSIVFTPQYGSQGALSNGTVSIPGRSVTINLPPGGNSQWIPPANWQGAPLPAGTLIQQPPQPDGPVTLTLGFGTTTVTGTINVGPIAGGTPEAMTVKFVANSGGSVFQAGETVVGSVTGQQAQVGVEFDNTIDGLLTLQNPTGFFGTSETIIGQSSGASAVVKYQYHNVLTSPTLGQIGVSSSTNQGTTIQMPYDAQPGDNILLYVQPMIDTTSTMADPTAILSNTGLTITSTLPQDPDDCSWGIHAVNNSGGVITINDQMSDPSTGATLWVKGLTANGVVVKALADVPAGIGGPTMTSCNAFTLTFLQSDCSPITGGTYDPTVGLAHMGLTNITPPTSGPDELGQWVVRGVWELGSGFTLPTSKHITITAFTDHGPAKNVATGNCATSLPFTITPGDTVNMIVRPVAAPGQPMTNPVAVLTGLGFTNITPASTYSDCTFVMTADYSGNGNLQITDPLVSPGFGAMWVVGCAVNSTTIKDANWIQLQPEDLTLAACGAYTVFFTYAICPALTGAPGSWDPTADLQALLPGFKLAPGPNEYGEWSATGVWQGADQTVIPGSSGNITFTFVVDYGPSQGCTPPPVPCVAPQVADSVTGACGAACSDGSAPASGVCAGCVAPQVADSVTGACGAACSDGSAPQNGVCPQPVKAAPPVTPPAAATTSTGTVVAVGAAVVAAGVAGYFLLA